MQTMRKGLSSELREVLERMLFLFKYAAIPLIVSAMVIFSPIYYVYYINHKTSQETANTIIGKRELLDEIERKSLDAKIKTLPINMVRWVYEINEYNIEDNDQQLVKYMTENLKNKYLNYLKNRHNVIKDLRVSYQLDNLMTKPITVSKELLLADGKKIYVQPSRFDVLIEAQISAFRNNDNTKVYSRPIILYLHLVTSASKDNGGLLVDDLEEIQWNV